MIRADNYDVGIIGSNLTAAIIAGLVMRDHKKKTCLFINPSVQQQISREIAVSFNCVTRPPTWQMLENAIAESLPILTRIGGGNSLAKTNALIICQSRATANALSHMYHYLHGQDYDIERLAQDEFKNSIVAYRVHGLRLVRPQIMWPAILKWLASIGVVLHDPDALQINTSRDGSAKIKFADKHFNVGRLVLADTQAILAYGAPPAVEKLFLRKSVSAVVSQPLAGLTPSVIINPENNFYARLKADGTISFLADGNIQDFHTQADNNILRNQLVANDHIRLAGRTIYQSLKVKDGAPIIGRLGRSSIWGCAGFGQASAFMAPMLARYICDKATEKEQAYFAIRGGDSKRDSAHIFDGCTLWEIPS